MLGKLPQWPWSTAFVAVPIAAMLAFGVVAPPASALATAGPQSVTMAAATRAGVSPSKLERRVFRLTNKARKHGRFCGKVWYRAVPRLSYSNTLGLAARRHSADMAKRKYFSHYTPEGLAPWDRIDKAGYGPWSSAGENIAAGQPNPKAAIKAWLKSPPHCTGIMSKSLRQIGVGHAAGGPYGHYWTQDFATPR